MKTIFLKGELRSEVGTRTAKVLRAEGKVPCNMYGLADGNINFAVYQADFKNLVYTPNVYKVKIELDGKNYDAILQDIQFHPVSDKILHIDFFQLNDEKEIVMEVPVKIVGNSKGVMAGGVLRLNQRRLKVKALPKNLPDFVEASISELQMGNKLYVTKLETNNFKLMHPDNTVVCQVRISRAAMKAAQEAAKAEKGGKKKK